MKKFIKVILLVALFGYSGKEFRESLLRKERATEEQAIAKMKEQLKERYGEEFVITNVAPEETETSSYYRAQILPKSFKGTSREFDEYYEASATIKLLPYGKLDDIGENYNFVNLKIEAEKYLMPKLNELFGDYVMIYFRDLKMEEDIGGNWGWDWYKQPYFEKALEDIKNNPTKRRMKFDVWIYVIDRIDNEKEKKKREKDIKELLNYLDELGLGKHINISTYFVEDVVLANNFKEIRREINSNKLISKKLSGIDYDLIPYKSKIKKFKSLKKDLKKMSKVDLLNNFNKFNKLDINTYKTFSIGFIDARMFLNEEDECINLEKAKGIEIKKLKNSISNGLRY